VRVTARRGPLHRALLRLGHVVASAGAPAVRRRAGGDAASTAARLARLPWPQSLLVPVWRSPAKPWSAPIPPPPAELRTVPGIRRNSVAEDDASRRNLLRWFFGLHADSMAPLSPHMWLEVVTVAPNLLRATRRLVATRDRPPAAVHSDTDPARLTAALK
jgi:hypothetical protein